jgi:hypothetical protein
MLMKVLVFDTKKRYATSPIKKAPAMIQSATFIF